MQQQSNFFLLDIFKQRKIHEIGLASARMTKQGTQFGHVLDPLCKMVYFRDNIAIIYFMSFIIMQGVSLWKCMTWHHKTVALKNNIIRHRENIEPLSISRTYEKFKGYNNKAYCFDSANTRTYLDSAVAEE